VANFSYDIDSCTNKIAFTDISNNVNNNTMQWNWNFGDNDTSIIQNPAHSYAQGNSYTVTLVATAANGCIDTIAVPIILKQYANYFITPDTLVCKVPVQLQLHANGGDFYSWEPANIFNDDLIQNPIATINTLTNISVLIGRINTDGDTCSTRLNSAINVSTLNNFVLEVSADNDTIFAGESSQLLAEIPANAVCIWLPAEGLNNATIYNPIASPTKTTEYTVNVSDNGGCSVSKKVKITVLNSGCGKPGIFVPNTFTPNGDGKNDQLFVRGNFIATLFFAVYNRWGEKVFETTDKKMGWDGLYKGTEADAGVFGWYLQVVCKDGEETILKGNVTLIR
jgi:gliding motility-associated-like protein